MFLLSLSHSFTTSNKGQAGHVYSVPMGVLMSYFVLCSLKCGYIPHEI